MFYFLAPCLDQLFVQTNGRPLGYFCAPIAQNGRAALFTYFAPLVSSLGS